MAQGLYIWSKTAGSNGTVDSSINFAEGMAPSAVNDSARAVMARVSEFRDDISATITTTNSTNAYSLSSNQVFDTLAHQNMIAFIANATNTGTATLNVDSLGAKPLRAFKGVELPAGTLIAGSPYVAYYNSSDAVWYLGGMSGTAMVPLGTILDYAGSSAPSTNFALPYGQAVSRTTYATLFGIIGTTYGTGDGSTTFNLPDIRGRTVFGLDNMGGSAANRITNAVSSIDGTSLGANGGNQKVTLARNNLPNTSVSVSVSITDPGHSHTYGLNHGNLTTASSGLDVVTTNGGLGVGVANASATTGISASGSFNLNGSVTQADTIIMPPAIVLGKIIRVL